MLLQDLIVQLGLRVGNTAAIGVLDQSLNAFTQRQMTNIQNLNARIENTTTKAAIIMGTYSAAMTGIITASAGTAARTQVLNTAMEQVAKTTGKSKEALNEQREAMIKGGITTQEATIALIRFMQAEIDLDKASKLARASQDLAAIAGMNSSQAFGVLTDSISSLNTMMLNQFGLTKNLNDIMRDGAMVLRKRVNDMSEMEKKQAMLNYILKESEKSAGTYEETMNDVGKLMTSFPRYFEEARNKIGKVWLPLWLDLAKSGKDFLETFNKIPQPMMDVLSASAGIGVAFATLSVAIIGLTKSVGGILMTFVKLFGLFSLFSGLKMLFSVIKFGLPLIGTLTVALGSLIDIGILGLAGGLVKLGVSSKAALVIMDLALTWKTKALTGILHGLGTMATWTGKTFVTLAWNIMKLPLAIGLVATAWLMWRKVLIQWYEDEKYAQSELKKLDAQIIEGRHNLRQWNEEWSKMSTDELVKANVGVEKIVSSIEASRQKMSELREQSRKYYEETAIAELEAERRRVILAQFNPLLSGAERKALRERAIAIDDEIKTLRGKLTPAAEAQTQVLKEQIKYQRESAQALAEKYRIMDSFIASAGKADKPFEKLEKRYKMGEIDLRRYIAALELLKRYYEERSMKGTEAWEKITIELRENQKKQTKDIENQKEKEYEIMKKAVDRAAELDGKSTAWKISQYKDAYKAYADYADLQKKILEDINELEFEGEKERRSKKYNAALEEIERMKANNEATLEQERDYYKRMLKWTDIGEKDKEQLQKKIIHINSEIRKRDHRQSVEDVKEQYAEENSLLERSAKQKLAIVEGILKNKKLKPEDKKYWEAEERKLRVDARKEDKNATEKAYEEDAKEREHAYREMK